MSFPRFTAEAALYRPTTSYRTVANSLNLRLQVIPALGIWGGGGISTSCAADCADKANQCTSNCRPDDGACRDHCDAWFWMCLDHCNVVTGLGLGSGLTIA
jgi:hypothetical protein